jgi:hypothetical protein
VSEDGVPPTVDELLTPTFRDSAREILSALRAD